MNIPPHIKAVIFDLDGLLIDSEPVWEKAGDVFLGKYGHKHDPAIGDIRGMGLRDIVLLWQKELGLQGETTSLLQELRSEFYTLALEQKQLQLLPGVEKTIRYFEGKKRAIATGGHKKKQIKILLANFGLHPYFDDVISSDDVSKGKPDPEVYLFTASR
ncbi:MAG: HAD family hydrolase, partial [Acidobacteriota bacterium]